MKYRDLRDFLAQLERLGELRKLGRSGVAALEMTAVRRPFAARGRAGGAVHAARRLQMPVLINLFGTPERVALGMGADVGRPSCATSAGCWPR
jgi:4-hydroxy-3-polyprenylbenzoate decarboxylase